MTFSTAVFIIFVGFMLVSLAKILRNKMYLILFIAVMAASFYHNF